MATRHNIVVPESMERLIHDMFLQIVKELKAFLKEFFGIDVIDEEIAVLQSGRQLTDGFKNSYHLLINNGFGLAQPKLGGHSDMQLAAEAFKATLPPELASWVDTAVYNANRPWRTLNQRGGGKTVPLTPVPEYSTGEDLEHYVQQMSKLSSLIWMPGKREQAVALCNWNHDEDMKRLKV
eukprot:COSAG02_NODE_17919_length_971_cov_1.522936_1_plen_180_part_00